MSSIIIKIVSKDDSEAAAKALGELEGANYSIVYQGSADLIGVDDKNNGGGEQQYSAGYVIVGKNEV